jgi:acyl-CoA synthetase (NDP forming)
MLDDDRVTALGLYVEGIGDARAFAAMAEAARAAGKGIVAIKSGKTPGARAAAASHTAALAGGGAASSAFLAACGVAEVATPAELLETLKLLHVHGPGLGRRLCAVACSGGEAGLTADLAGPMGLDLPPPSEDARARLSATLGPLVTIANPLDYHTFIWGDGPRTTEVFATMLSGYDAGLYLIDPPRPDRCDPSSYDPALAAIEAAQAITGRPALPVASLPENLPEDMAEAMIGRGIAPMMGVETALAAVRAAQVPPGRPGWRPLPARPEPGARLLPEDEAKAILAEAGIAVPRGVVADDLHEVGVRAAVLARPLAVKGLGLAHKTEAGAVRLRAEPWDVAPMPGVTGYLAEEMVTDAVAEILIGAVRDPVYGVTLTLGMGGVEAELLADTVTLIAPATAHDIAAALRRLRLWPRLDGYRGRPRADTAAAVEAALAVQALMEASRRFVEIEVNPLMLRASGAVAVDALIRVEE